MKIYLDIVYLINVYLGFLCLLSLDILFNRNENYQKMAIISFFWGLVVLAIYLPCTYMIFFIWSFLISLLIDRKHCLKIFFLWIFLYFTYTTSFFHFENEVERCGPILIVGMSFQWIYAIVLGTIVTCLYLAMSFYLKKDNLKHHLIFPVQIKNDDKIYDCHGFMDTGNQVVVDGYPVVFTRTDFSGKQQIYLERVGGKQQTQACLVQLYFENRWQDVYLAYMEDLHLTDAEVLLNLELL